MRLYNLKNWIILRSFYDIHIEYVKLSKYRFIDIK